MQNQSNSTPLLPKASASSDASAALGDVHSDSIEELINRAPNLTDAEVDRIVERLRAQRERFAAQEAAPKEKKGRAKKEEKNPISADDLLSSLE